MNLLINNVIMLSIYTESYLQTNEYFNTFTINLDSEI
jgi:hypothetical protein